MTRPSRRARAIATAFLAVGLLVAPPRPASAWGPQGHRVIARVAADRLSPAARAGVRELLHPDDTLPDVAGWADREGHDVYPGSAPWHFANIPIDAKHYRDGRDANRPTNVVHQIARQRAIVADRSKPKQERQRALLLLVHFVQDLHQPLHVGDADDRGGNDTQVRFFGEGTNLHQLWDSGLIHRVGGSDAAWAGRIERAITPEAAREWARGTPEDWADESLQAAKVAYHDLDDEPRLIPKGFDLGAAYLKEVEPILVEQMARASVRLAAELDAAFAEAEAGRPAPARRPAAAPR